MLVLDLKRVLVERVSGVQIAEAGEYTWDIPFKSSMPRKFIPFLHESLSITSKILKCLPALLRPASTQNLALCSIAHDLKSRSRKEQPH